MIWAMAAFIVILMALVAWGDLKLMIGFLVLVAVAATTFLAYENWSDRRSAQRVGTSEVELLDFSLQPLAGGVFELTGRVHNHAGRYALKRLTLKVVAQDCSGGEKLECIAIGETQPVLKLNVPAGQARDIKEKVMFRDGRPQARGELRWEFDVLSTRGG